MWADLAICREFIRRFTPIPMVRGEKWRNGGCFGWLISIIAGKHLFSTINTTTPYIGYHYLFWFHQCLTVRHFLKYPWRILSEFLWGQCLYNRLKECKLWWKDYDYNLNNFLFQNFRPVLCYHLICLRTKNVFHFLFHLSTDKITSKVRVILTSILTI